MGLLDYADSARKKLRGLLGDMPIVQAAQGQANVSLDGLRNAMMAMRPFQGGADTAYEAALNIGPMGLGKIVYHGSPHKFDKFDASKIGTGEGAQAYGHGVYLADAEDVAGSYAGMRPMAGAFTKNGQPWVAGTYAEAMAESRLRAGKGYDATIEKAKKEADSAIASRNHEEAQRAQDIVAALKAMKSAGVEPNTGSLYKADLPDEWIPKMLDWDKPLSQQSPEVQKVIDAHIGKVVSFDPINNTTFRMNFSGSPIGGYWGDKNKAIQEAKKYITGKQFYEAVGKLDNISYPDSAAFLKEQDIPGIRYLDGGSRGKGQGSYNYVVFPGLEDKVKILERNGIPINDGLLGRK